MEKQDPNILDSISKKGGFKVPENYFAKFNEDFMDTLPQVKKAPEVKVSMWVKVRPYVYMAAMFAGIWCMMKIFGDISNSASTQQQIEAIAGDINGNDGSKMVVTQDSVTGDEILTYQDSIQADIEN